jgi:hypothetical protein
MDAANPALSRMISGAPPALQENSLQTLLPRRIREPQFGDAPCS